MGESHVVVGLNALLFAGIVLLSTLASYILRRNQITYIPESGAAMLLGMSVGAVLLLAAKQESQDLMFHREVFFFVLLPPIIFEAGFSLQRKSFFSNMGSILLFSVMGTFVSTIVIGYGLYGLASAGVVPLNGDDPLESLMYGALISAVDPVATLSILGSDSVGADPLLYSLVFGESVLNDAVSIVLFNTFKNFHGRGAFDDVMVFEVIGQFIGISLGSIVVGLLIGLSSAFVTNKSKLREYQEFEFTFVLFASYTSYCMAEILELSGIMALFFCGIVMAHYTWYNISKVSQTTTKWGFKSFANIAEQFVFAYLGITAVISIRPDFNFRWSASLCFFTMLLCVVGRFFNIIPLSLLVNIRRRKPITWKMQLVMWFAGLRGAIAFALSLNMPEDIRAYAVTTTMVVVIFTTLVCGGFTETVLRRLGLQGEMEVPASQSANLIEQTNVADEQPQGDASTNNGVTPNGSVDDDNDDDEIPGFGMKINSDHHYTPGGFHERWHNFDRAFMFSHFGGRAFNENALDHSVELTAMQSQLDSDMMMAEHSDGL